MLLDIVPWPPYPERLPHWNPEWHQIDRFVTLPPKPTLASVAFLVFLQLLGQGKELRPKSGWRNALSRARVYAC